MRGQGIRSEQGFSIAEFLVSTIVVMSLSASLFHMLTDMQSSTGYQTEVLGVTENTRAAMNILGRHIGQAGNNPRSATYAPVTVTGATQVRLCTDLTGSSGGSQGDPDGDILDDNEDITVRFNQQGRSIELVGGNGTVRTLANYISGFSLQYFDANGNTATTDASVSRIRVTVSGASTAAEPRTGKVFAMTLASDFTLPNRGI